MSVSVTNSLLVTNALEQTNAVEQANELMLPTQATPTFSPAAGGYASVQSVTIASAGADHIYYTTNGSTPTTSSTLYTGPVTVSVSETLKAIAVKANYNNSAVGSAAYVITITLITPTFTLSAGISQTVTVNMDPLATSTYYTTDGSTPDATKTLYSSPFSISAGETIKAISYAVGYTTSAVGSQVYTKLSTPVATPTGGSYVGAQSVTYSVDAHAVTTYYTTDGSTPTTSSTVYSGAITVPVGSETLKAISVGAGYVSSAASSDAYSVSAPVVATAGNGNDSGGALTSAALNTTGASLLVVTFSTYGGDAPTLTDSKGNTWHFVTGAPSGVSRGRIAYAWNKGAGALSTGTGHTITIQDSAASGTAYTFMAFWGIQTVSDPSYGTTNSASITTGTTVQPGIVTPSIGDLVIASLGHYPGGVSGYTATVDSSYTIPCGNTGAAGSGPYADNWGAYIIAPSGSDLDPTWTVGQAFAPGHSGSTMAIGFKHA